MGHPQFVLTPARSSPRKGGPARQPHLCRLVSKNWGTSRLSPDFPKRAHVIAGEIRYVGKETDRKWEEGDEISILEFAATEYGRKGKVVASEEIKAKISSIGINKCARESGFDRKNFIRKLMRDTPVKRSSYSEFVRWLKGHNSVIPATNSLMSV